MEALPNSGALLLKSMVYRRRFRKTQYFSNKKCGKFQKKLATFLAAGEGFEPSHTESESAVLPLHKPARSVGRSDQPQRTDIIIQNIAFLSIGFFKVFHFFRRGE